MLPGVKHFLTKNHQTFAKIFLQVSANIMQKSIDSGQERAYYSIMGEHARAAHP